MRKIYLILSFVMVTVLMSQNAVADNEFKKSLTNSVSHKLVSATGTIGSVPITDIQPVTSGAFEYIHNEDHGTVTITKYTDETAAAVNFPEQLDGYTVTGISDSVFESMTTKNNITNIAIPSTISEIAEGAFRGCNMLSDITVAAGNLNYKSENGILFSKDMSLLVFAPSQKLNMMYTIPDGVEILCRYSLCGSNLMRVTIPRSVKYIKAYAFYGVNLFYGGEYLGYLSEWRQVQIEEEGNSGLLKASLSCLPDPTPLPSGVTPAPTMIPTPSPKPTPTPTITPTPTPTITPTPTPTITPTNVPKPTETPVTQSLPAFPGAEGGGMYATGARAAANPEIYHVTTLADYDKNLGEPVIKGSLRDAVSKGNRIVVFDVAGNIELKARLNISGGDLTILGQTAPGDGICVTGYDTHINSSNVILRYLRFRMGDKNDIEDDSLGGRNVRNVIIDHCSISWSVDECASFYDNTNFTMQWCIISESLNNSIHEKGSHGYGGIWGGRNASFHHNLMAHHKSRTPRAPEGDFKMIVGKDDGDYDMSQQNMISDWRNNVIYNWGINSAYGGQAALALNIVNCYYKSGPATGSGVKDRIYELTSTGNGQTFVWSTDLYLDGNYINGYPDVTENNAMGVSKDFAAINYYVWTNGLSGVNHNNVKYSSISDNTDAQNVHFKYQNDYPVDTETAEEAYESVLAGAGASLSRDSLDARVVDDVRNGTAEHGTNGIIDTPEQAGGLPSLSGKPEPDTDADGLPDKWEDLNGTNKTNASDAAEILTSGYTNIEKYANDLIDGIYPENNDPSPSPTAEVFTPDPTNTPEPTATPIIEATHTPTAEPTSVSSTEPSFTPVPTEAPTPSPSASPTANPTSAPTPVSSTEPSFTPVPTETPTSATDLNSKQWKIKQIDYIHGGIDITVGDKAPIGTPFTVIMAKYKDDILLDIFIEKHETEADGGSEYFVKLDRMISAQDTNEYVKLMLWNNTEACKPLAETYEAPYR